MSHLYIVLASSIVNQEECSSVTAVTNPSTSEAHNLLAVKGTAPLCTEIPYTVPAFVSEPTKLTQDLRDYFSRQRMIRTGTFSASKGNIISDVVSPASLAGWYPNFLQRLTGVYAIRFTLNFTLRASPTPFAQGLSCLSWQYGSDAVGVSSFDRGSFSFSCTQLPHARLNFQDNNEVSISVPFLSCFDYFPLREADFENVVFPFVPYGTVFITNITPCPVPPNSTAVVWKLYLHLTDLELIGSTSWVDNTAVLNSGVDEVVKQVSIATGTDRMVKRVKKVAKGLATADKELRKSKVISSTLGVVGKGLDLVSKVPIIGSFAGTPAWLANTLAGTAAAFGYAAPAVEEATQLKLNRYTLDPTHIDVPIASTKLSPFQSNKLEVSEVLGACEEDVMSLAYVLQKPSQLFVGSMTTTQAANTLLYGTKVSLYSFWYRSTGNGNLPLPTSSTLTTNCIYPSTLLYLADHFRYWRGGLKFHLTFAKTQFHAGQVLVTFIPFAESVSVLATPAPVSNTLRIPESAGGLTQPNQFSMIIDLRSGTEFEFVVPFVFPTPYAGVVDSIGSLSMVVLNPLLVGSSQAATSINFVVEVSACDDFEFATVVPPSLSTTVSTVGDTFLESGVEVVSNSEEAADLFPVARLEPSAAVVGEKINSLKQLAMIPTWYLSDQGAVSLFSYFIPNWSYRPAFTMTTPMSTTAQVPLAVTHSGKVASMFVFSNGSTRFTVQPQDPTVGNASIVINHRPNPGNSVTGIYSGLSSQYNKRNYANGATIISSTGTTTVDVPWYTKVMRVNHGAWNAAWFPRNYAGTTVIPRASVGATIQGENIAVATIRNVSSSSRVFHFAYAAGEDATAAAYIGPAPVILFNSLSTVDPNSTDFQNDQLS